MILRFEGNKRHQVLITLYAHQDPRDDDGDIDPMSSLGFEVFRMVDERGITEYEIQWKEDSSMKPMTNRP